jgi:YidC/Oxa1 family membrane protein insertase
MNFLREIGQFLRFFWRTTKEQKQIVFYAENAGYFAYLEGLVNELVDRRGGEVCYVTSDPDDPLLSDHRGGLHVFYLRTLLPYFMILVNCRVFVMTLTDLHRYHLKRSMHAVHYLYVFHSPVSTHMMYRAGAFDHYDSILCVGPHHIEEIGAYEKLRGLSPKQLVPAGYYRLERIHGEYHKQKTPVPDSSWKATILVAPSWGEHNLLRSCGAELIRPLLEGGYRVIVRPHPETVRRESELLAHLDRAFAGHDGYNMERSVRTDDSLLAADLLVCDLSGVALEYALGTERPVLFVDVPPKVRNPEYADLGREPIELALREEIGELVPPDDLAGVAERVDRILSRRDQYRDKLAALRDRIVYEFGGSAAIGADHIMRMVQEDD